MNPTFPRARPPLSSRLPATVLAAALTAALNAALAAGLTACGGGGLQADASADAGAADGQAELPATPAPVTTLWDDDGNLMPVAAAAPSTDPAAVRGVRQVTPEQAAQLEDLLGVGVIPVNVEPRPDTGAVLELARQLAWAHLAVYDLSPDAPVLVRSSDPPLAAAVVQQLEAAGYTRVMWVMR